MVSDQDTRRSVQASRRVVLLGASNLARGISTIVESTRLAWGEPLDFIAALGHGRSYGMTSTVLGRTLPSILACGLWDSLNTRQPLNTAALITDIGNDILYGANDSQIASWVEQCLQRLAPVCDKITVTELPLDSVLKMRPWRFGMVRNIMFPKSKLTFDDAMRTVRTLNERVQQLADRYGAALVRPKEKWYGIDPIHIKMWHRRAAWREVFSTWNDDDPSWFAKSSFARWCRLRRQRPLERKMFGKAQHRAQPTCELDDRIAISLF